MIHHAHELDLRAEFLEALGVAKFLYSHRRAIIGGLIYIRIGTYGRACVCRSEDGRVSGQQNKTAGGGDLPWPMTGPISIFEKATFLYCAMAMSGTISVSGTSIRPMTPCARFSA